MINVGRGFVMFNKCAVVVIKRMSSDIRPRMNARLKNYSKFSLLKQSWINNNNNNSNFQHIFVIYTKLKEQLFGRWSGDERYILHQMIIGM